MNETQAVSPARASKAASITGWVITCLAGLFLLSGGINSILMVEMVVNGAKENGFDVGLLRPLGIVLTLSSLLYFFPRTCVLGATLLTGYLGGACSVHVLKGDPLINILVPVIFGVLVWLGLYLRMPALRRLTPWQCA